jgi:beta-barrel assembly-enhancing protease
VVYPPAVGIGFQGRTALLLHSQPLLSLRKATAQVAAQDRNLPSCEKTFQWQAVRRLGLVAVCATALLAWTAAGWASDTKDPQHVDKKHPALEVNPVAIEGASATAQKAGKSDKPDLDQIGARGVGGGLNMYSLERERALGASMAAAIDRHTKFCADPEVYDYINGLAQKIARHSDAQVPFTIKVIDSPDLNIFSLPGGYLYVNEGLITQLDSEAELAGLMAHEIAHVAARHGTRLATRKNAWNMISTPISYAAGPAAPVTQLVPLTFKKFSRDAEFEADLLGLEYQNAAGYDPQAFLDALEKWNSNEKQRQARLKKSIHAVSWLEKLPLHNQIEGSLSNYPKLEDRIQKVQAEMSTVLPAREDYVTNTSEFEDVKAKLAWADRPVLRRHTPGEPSNAPVLRRHPTDQGQPEVTQPEQLEAVNR